MSTCNYVWNSSTSEYIYKCEIVDECCAECSFIGAFTIDGECFYYSGVSSIGPYSARFSESDKSIENNPDESSSYLSPDTDGKYQFYRPVGDTREKCVSNGYISDFDSLVDINKLGWDCSEYTGFGDKNPSVSCGCWVQDSSISKGVITGIVLGSIILLIVVCLFVLCYVKNFCRYRSNSVITKVSDAEHVEGVSV